MVYTYTAQRDSDWVAWLSISRSLTGCLSLLSAAHCMYTFSGAQNTTDTLCINSYSNELSFRRTRANARLRLRETHRERRGRCGCVVRRRMRDVVIVECGNLHISAHWDTENKSRHIRLICVFSLVVFVTVYVDHPHAATLRGQPLMPLQKDRYSRDPPFLLVSDSDTNKCCM